MTIDKQNVTPRLDLPVKLFCLSKCHEVLNTKTRYRRSVLRYVGIICQSTLIAYGPLKICGEIKTALEQSVCVVYL